MIIRDHSVHFIYWWLLAILLQDNFLLSPAEFLNYTREFPADYVGCTIWQSRSSLRARCIRSHQKTIIAQLELILCYYCLIGHVRRSDRNDSCNNTDGVLNLPWSVRMAIFEYQNMTGDAAISPKINCFQFHLQTINCSQLQTDAIQSLSGYQE